MHPNTVRCKNVWEYDPYNGILKIYHICERGGQMTTSESLQDIQRDRIRLTKALHTMRFYPSFSEAQKALSVFIKLAKKNHRRFEDPVH